MRDSSSEPYYIRLHFYLDQVQINVYVRTASPNDLKALPTMTRLRTTSSIALFALILSTALSLTVLAQSDEDDHDSGRSGDLDVEAYGEFNYQRYNWQTDTARRATVDLERAAVEATYQVNDMISVEGEVEFEHGGSGVAMEFDKVEEFGEFEREVEKGGEVTLEKLAATFAFDPCVNLRIGHIYVPIGLVNSDYEPLDYFTTTRPEMESAMLPATWHETGLELFGSAGPFSYQALVVNGLDATGFSSANWIKHGQQGRFELVNAENLALAARVDVEPIEDVTIGASGYFGNSADNRPKPDLEVPADVTIGEAHATLARDGIMARGVVLYGELQNAGAVSRANRNLSNNLDVKRTPVGSAAFGWSVEAGYDLFEHIHPFGIDNQRLDVFGRYEYYDTMYRVDATVFDNPRWERSVWTAGINYRPHPDFVFKAQFSRRTLGLDTANREDTFSLGMGFEL